MNTVIYRYINYKADVQATLYSCFGHEDGNYCVVHNGVTHYYHTRRQAVFQRNILRKKK